MPSCEMRRMCVTVRAPRARSLRCLSSVVPVGTCASLSAPSCRRRVFGMSPDRSDREDTEQTKSNSQERASPSADLTCGGLLASCTLGSACIMRRPRLPPVSNVLRRAYPPSYGRGRRELLGAVGMHCAAPLLGLAVFRGGRFVVLWGRDGSRGDRGTTAAVRSSELGMMAGEGSIDWGTRWSWSCAGVLWCHEVQYPGWPRI